ncbi:TetR/AcrR family transcriptional regulator [Streptomyces sp. NBC_00209]|uniref:TetR/AcrR family transcriptional regulator n=1 Tax=Streptomyces sp. NBC_00209 TaxID=2975682 RepID=UPI0032437ECD
MSDGGARVTTSSEGYAKGRARRAEIVTAAVAVYADKGFHSASLREIAKRAGISHVGLHYYFPSREALLAAVLERRDEEDSALLAPKVFTPRAVVRHLLDLADHNARRRGMVELYVRLAAEAITEDHPAHRYFREHYRSTREYVHRALRELAERGALRDGVDPRVAAAGFGALMDGLQVQWLTSPDAVDMGAVLGSYVQQLLKESSA